MKKDQIADKFNSAQGGGSQNTENRTKRILYLAETPYYETACIDELRDCGYDVHVAGQKESGVAIDCAMRHLRNPAQKFDLVISGMVLACGFDNFSIEETRSGWQTGLVFAKRLREEGINVPVLIHELDTGLGNLDGYSRSKGTLKLLPDSKAQVPVLRKEDGYEALVEKVREMIGKPVPPAPGPTGNIDNSLAEGPNS